MGIQAALGQVTALVGGWRRNQARRDSAVTRGHLARGRKRDPLGDDVGAHLHRAAAHLKATTSFGFGGWWLSNIRGPTMAREWPCSHPQSSGPAPRWPVTGHIMHCLKSRQDDSARGTRPGDGGGWVVGCQPCSQHGRSPTAWDEVLGPSVGPVPQARLAHRASKSVVLAKCCGIFRETTANFSSSGRATREPGGLGRRPTTRTRRRTPEDHATLPRRSTRAQTALPRRSRLVWRSARLNQKCTTR